MQVLGLPRQITRNARAASRLLEAKPPDREAERRRDAVARWRRAMADGLTAAQAARAVGVPRATLYRWEKDPVPRSRRPRTLRKPAWTPALAKAVEELRADNPMYGKRKLAVLLRREGVVVSTSAVGRIPRRLMDRGLVTPVPTLRRHPDARRFRFTGRQRYARRLPKGLKPTRPGEIVQIDALFVNVAPNKAIKHFTAYDPVAKWTVGRVANSISAQSAKALLDKLIAEAPFPVSGIQVDGGSEFKADFEQACAAKGLALFVLPPKRPQLNGAVERAQGSWRYEFYGCFDLPYRIDQLQAYVDAFAYRFNHQRPHQPSGRHSIMLRMPEPLAPFALGDRTPAQYLESLSHEVPASHMP